MPTAVITTGTTMGEISMLMTAVRKGKFERLRPSAARVPRKVASTVVLQATKIEFCSAPCQRSVRKKSSYQRSDNPGIG